jgi:hypothetical protein
VQTHALARIAAVPLLILAWSQAACAADTPAPTTCKDGTTSTATGRGACSSHGGVQKPAPAASSSASSSGATAASAPPAGAASVSPAPGSAPTPAAEGAKTTAKPPSGNTDPTGATAKCTDGTYSKAKTHSGACSHHGGVAQWLGSPP